MRIEPYQEVGTHLALLREGAHLQKSRVPVFLTAFRPAGLSDCVFDSKVQL